MASADTSVFICAAVSALEEMPKEDEAGSGLSGPDMVLILLEFWGHFGAPCIWGGIKQRQRLPQCITVDRKRQPNQQFLR